jgi:hypothetical protein
VLFRGEVGLDDVADEVAPCLGSHRICRHLRFLFGFKRTFCQIRTVQPSLLCHGPRL